MDPSPRIGFRRSPSSRLPRTLPLVFAVLVLTIGPAWPSGTDDLIGSVMQGDLETISALIDGGVDVNGKTKDGTPPLVLAASYRGYEDVVELLVAKGADVNLADAAGRTPLMSAAAASKTGTELLLSRGADVKAKSTAGATALHHCYMGHLDGADRDAVARALVAAGADVNAAMTGGTTPLMIAAEAGDLAAVDLLMSKGARAALVRASDGKTALVLAREAGQERVVERLQKP